MRWLIFIFLFPILLHGQQEINLRQFSFIIPDSIIYGDTCNMSMHGYFSCNDITTRYLEIKNDTVFYYLLETEDEHPKHYSYITIETCPLASIDTSVSYIWQDKYSPKYWNVVIELKRNTKRKNKIWHRTYWKTGKSEHYTQWRTSIQCWDPMIFDKIKQAVKNLKTKE